ncbi:rhodanese-like domain-containing protein [Cupriavidus necator]|uniref:rhodanese-like domain-containing protein n=1 Tax=Cupriavidus necator TaxID=106590 RepID=UPI0039C48943
MPKPAFTIVDAVTLKGWLHDAAEIALFDVREHGQYGEGHPFYAVPLPYSRLELDVGRLAPRIDVRIALADDGDGVAQVAAQALARLGYTSLFVLDGGMPAWRAAGYTLFAGVNVPSKTFGELAEHHYGTPRVSARELAAMQAGRAGARVPVVLDGRPASEFHKMNIPGAICCPNGELAYRLRDLVPDTETPIVINCAGRTRSIVGAQSLINFGVANPVYALENGTQGWYLNDFRLEHGGTARYPDNGSPRGLDAARDAARGLAQRFAVPHIAPARAANWVGDPARTTFLCDVRTAEEFAARTLRGARHTPGGQLMQATDQYIGVRRARLVLFDADGVRAPVVASWLRQMGHDAVVLEGGLQAGLEAGIVAAHGPQAEVVALPTVDAAALAAGLQDRSMLALDLRGSMAYRAGHIAIAGSRWSIRPRLAQDLAGVPQDTTVVLIGESDAGDPTELAVADLHALGFADVRRLRGGLAAWQRAGYPLDEGAHMLPDTRCIDFLFFVHDRHDGNKAAARQYLAWETNLVGQLDAQELATFNFPPAS